MSSETERLEREAEQHRNQVDDTLDRLRERFSVGQIVDELSGYVREGQGADMVKNLNRQVRDNPLALGLVGAGIAWLFMGQGVREESHRLKGRYDDWRGEDDLYDRDRISGGGYPVADGRPHTVGVGPYAGAAPLGTASASSASSTGNTGPGLGERARDAVHGASERASAAGASASASMRSAGDRVSGAAHSAGERVSDAAHSASDRAGQALHDARDAAYDAGDRLRRGGSYAGDRAAYYGRRARRSFLDTLQEEPLIVGAVALAIGAAVGAALPATRREDAMFGETRDRLRDDAVDYGRDTLHRAEHVAEEAYKAGSDEAERKGLKPSGEGETLAQKASAVAGAAADAAKQDAKKEGLS